MGFSWPELQIIFKKLSQSGVQPSRCTYESGPNFFHYIMEGGVCFLTLCERGYPKKLAYQYLEELHQEFSRLYGPQVETVARPYAFIKFGELLAEVDPFPSLP
jgi:vesicle transport protein SEC22